MTVTNLSLQVFRLQQKWQPKSTMYIRKSLKGEHHYDNTTLHMMHQRHCKTMDARQPTNTNTLTHLQTNHDDVHMHLVVPGLDDHTVRVLLEVVHHTLATLLLRCLLCGDLSTLTSARRTFARPRRRNCGSNMHNTQYQQCSYTLVMKSRESKGKENKKKQPTHEHE